MTFAMGMKLSFGSVLSFLTKGAIALGILVRVNQYLFNRSLWADEAKLALNIVERNYWELTQALDYNQAAPLGFLFIEKFAIQLLGNHEYALRLFPLFCGIAALLLFYTLVRQYLNPTGVLIAVTLFAASSSLIYYSTEVKQYASDVAIALLLFLILIATHRHKCDCRQLALAAGVGALAVWFSFPAIFVLAGVEASYWIKNFWEVRSQGKPFQIATARIPIYLTWGVGFGSMYWCLLHSASTTHTLLDFWSNKFPTSIFDLDWLFASLKKFFVEPMDFRTPEFFPEIVDEAAMVAFLVGCFAWYKQQKATLLLFLAPTIATLVAAYLQKFPFEDRLVLFLVPFF
ncbi:hypothetical protein HC928_09555 [bacterium]|nr:hypothetical protein [bacterium]